MTQNTPRTIEVVPGYESGWMLRGVEGSVNYTEQTFTTQKQARRAVPQYARALGWKRSTYKVTVDA